jgi:AhpD family alkylhydroperoxidase
MTTKLPPVPRHELPEAFRALVDADLAAGRDPDMNSVLAHLPEFFTRYFDFYYPAHEAGVVPARIKELARLRIAALNGCATCRFARYASAEREGLDEACIAALDQPADERPYTPREALAVELAERLATDHRLVDDTFLEQLKKHFSAPEILELGMMIGQYIAFGRWLVVLGIHEYAHAPYRAGLG